MASPAFAKVIQSAPAYSQAAPPPADLPPTALSSDVAPQMPTAQPNVELAPLANEIGRDRGQLQKIQWAQENPYGTANNHPGKLGKLAHAFSMIGNIAGDIFAPSTMALIPGTQLNRQRSEGFLANRLNQEQEQQQQEMTQGAQEHESEERTKEAPAKAASEEGLQGAQVTNLESEARDRDAATAMGPTLAAGYSHAVNEAVKAGRDPAQDPIVQHLADSITAIQKQTVPKGMEKVDLVGPDGKPIAANYDPLKGTYTDATGKLIENPQPYEKPNQAGMITMIAPDPNNPGGGIVERLGAGAHVSPGAQTAAGVNSMNTPTTNQRTAGGRAETVLAMVPEVESRIDSVGSQMGPEMGRWNDFMQGKVGTNNPQFAALRSDLLMMSSAVALAHAQGRLPENLREEFDHAINSPKQTPQNLKATINAMVPWLQQVQSQGERSGAAPTQVAPTRPANVPEGYQFNAKGPKGAGWYATTAK